MSKFGDMYKEKGSQMQLQQARERVTVTYARKTPQLRMRFSTLNPPYSQTASGGEFEKSVLRVRVYEASAFVDWWSHWPVELEFFGEHIVVRPSPMQTNVLIPLE